MPGLEFLADNSFYELVYSSKFVLGVAASLLLTAGAVYLGYLRYRRIQRDEKEEAKRRYHAIQ